jgi:hypothetical protein
LLSLTAFRLAQIGVLLRSVQDNSPQQRETFFLETRSCRRRKQKDPRTTSLVTVFAMTDYYRCVFRPDTVCICHRVAGFKYTIGLMAFSFAQPG